MKQMRIKIISILLWMFCMALAQETPDFSYINYEGWTYSGGDLPSTSAFLYKTSDGRVLTLISPEFSCQDIDSIAVTVTWRSYDHSIALTTAIDDSQGHPVDSVTSLPSSPASIQSFHFTIPISVHRLSSARLRFVSWEAVVENAGTILKVATSAIHVSHQPPLLGDVDGDGMINISDVTALIDYLLNESATNDTHLENLDVDDDGLIGISDITALVDILLT